MVGILEGQTAVVTGGAYSIGRVFAEALAREGASLVIADIRDGATAAREIASAFGVDVHFEQTDVSAEGDVARLAGAVRERFGHADILVNNAALFADLPCVGFREIPVELFDRVMAVNVRGPFMMAQHLSPMMIEHGRGKIINIGSGTAYKGLVGLSAYVTSKAAILGLTRCLARELGPHGINVNTLAPGLTESPSAQDHPHHLEYTDKIIQSRALPRAEVPADLVGALVFLASPASDFVSGQTLAVDGGSIML